MPTQQLPQLHVPHNNYHTPSNVYSTASAQRQLPVRPAAPRPGIVVFGVGPNSLQIPNHYSNFPETSFQSGKSIPPSLQNTKAANPALKTNPTISVNPKSTVTYQQNIDPAKSPYPVQQAQLAKPHQYGKKLPTDNQHHKSQSQSAVSNVSVVKLPETVPVYISPLKSTIYASAYVSDSASYPEHNSYSKGETLKYQTTQPSISKPTVSSTYKETKAYPSTEIYLKTPTKSEITTPSSAAEVSESYAQKEHSYTEKKEYNVDKIKLKYSGYSETPSSKYLKSSPATENKKKEDIPKSLYSTPQYKTVSDKPSTSKPHDVSNVAKEKSKTTVYPIPQSYKKAESLSDYEEKKKLDAPSYVSSSSHGTQEQKPLKESYDKKLSQVSHVDESEPKVSVPSASLSHKEVDSSPDTENKKKFNSPSLPSFTSEEKPSSEPYKKNKESNTSESKPLKNPGYSAPGFYREIESLLPHTEDTKKQNVPNYVPTSKPYQPKSASISPVTKSPYSTQELKSYPQTESPSVLLTKATAPLKYSTESTTKTTTKTYKIPPQERTTSYYSTTSRYEESTTHSSLVTSTHLTQRGYTSPTSYEQSPISTTQGQSDSNQYPAKAYNTKPTSVLVPGETPYVSYANTGPSPVDKSNDRVYVISDPVEHENSYQKQGNSPSYQSGTSTDQYLSVDVRPSSANPVLTEYSSIEKSSSSTNYPTISTGNKSNYKTQPIESPADYLSTYNSKPNEKADSSKSFAAIAENYKTGDHDGSESEGDYSAIPGEPGTDYPIFSELPNNQFNCSEQRLPGYYADVSARCQVFHICLGDRQWSFLCPNGTIFSQEHFVCVWWYEFDCSKATGLYDLNEKLFVISSGEQQNDEDKYENKQYPNSAVSKTLTKSDEDYWSTNTKEERDFEAYN